MKNIISLLKVTRLFFISNLKSPEALFFGFAFPLIFTAIFSVIGQGTATYELGVYSDSLKEGVVYEAISNNPVLKLVQDRSDDQLKDDLNKGKIPAVLTISQEPKPQADEQIQTSVPSYIITLQTSEASPQNAQIVQTIVEKTISNINDKVNPNSVLLAQLQTESVSGRAYKRVDFILPGQLSFALLGTAVFGIAFSFITLRKTLVLKRMAATSSPRWVILGAKVLANIIITTIQAAVIIGVGYFFFDFTLVNGLWTFLAMVLVSVFGLLVFMSFGLLVASIARDEDSASPVANLITLPQFILSGSFFTIDILPGWLQNIARALPMTFLNDALRKISFEGGSLDTIAPQLLGLLAWAVIIYIPVVWLFRWE